MLETYLGQGREELLQVTQKMTESEKVTYGLIIKFEGLEKILRSLASSIILSTAGHMPIASLIFASAGSPQVAPTGIIGSGFNNTGGVKMPIFKLPGDNKVFFRRFEQYCLTQNVSVDGKSNLLLKALEEATFTVVKRKLTDAEGADFEAVKKHFFLILIYSKMPDRSIFFLDRHNVNVVKILSNFIRHF